MGVRSSCTVVWLRGVSDRIQKCHMQTYILVCDGSDSDFIFRRTLLGSYAEGMHANL